jgi:predicted DNA-binding transcriptional regulator AlpA
MPNYLTRQEVADLLKISTKSVSLAVKNGSLPQPVKVLQSDRWDDSELKQFIENNSRKGK